jgi:hypothetical protein
MKQPTILYGKFQSVGAYNLIHDEIHIDKDLRKNKVIHDLVLEHELGHRNHDKNIFQVIWRDIIDTPYISWKLYQHDFHHDKGMTAKLAVVEVIYFLASIFITYPIKIITDLVIISHRLITRNKYGKRAAERSFSAY